MVAVKDFYWEKAQGRWKRQSCRLGEGMVQVPKMLAILKATGFSGPISLHQEYQPVDQIADIRRDLEILKKHLNATYGA
jgi:sugar phosphate isomerase/epimerase